MTRLVQERVGGPIGEPIGGNADLTAQSSSVERRVPRPYSKPRVHSSQSYTKAAMMEFEVYT